MLHTRNEEPVSSDIRDTLGQYDLLIPIILRLVKRGASLEKSVQEQIDLNDKQMLTLRYMLKKTERIVLVLDGLDEFNTKTSRDITDIMTGNTFKHVIITSRAEAANKTKEWKQIMYKEAELKGFSDEHIKLYVNKFFKTSKDLASSLISHIFKKDSYLLELARNPGSLCMLCILHKDKIPIHSMNREQLYQEYVAFLLSRWEQRQNPEGQKTPRSEILKKYHEILVKFGELADINREPYTQDDDENSDSDESRDSEYYSSNSEYDSDSVKGSDNEDENHSDRDNEDIRELSFTLDQIKSILGEDAFNYGYLYKSHPSRLVPSRYSFIHKTLHEFFLAYFIKHHNLESFKQRVYKNRYLLYQELSLTRFILHLYMSPKQAFEFTTNIIGSKPDKRLFFVLLKLYQGYQHDEYKKTLTINSTQKGVFGEEYIYIYQYPCYVIHADRRHEDSLSSYNKEMIRRMNTDNKHKAVTVPILQTASRQVISCGDPWFLFGYDFYVYCRADYEVPVTGDGSKLEGLYLYAIEKMGDINLSPHNDRLEVGIYKTNLHGYVMLTRPWMALIQSLIMNNCKLEAGDISVIADSIQACTSPTGAESAFPCRLQELNLNGNSLTGAGADIARIVPCIPQCTEINLGVCDLNDEDFHAIVNAIIQTHSDRHTSVHDHSTPDRRQTKRFKPASPEPASHIDRRQTSRIKPASPGPASHTDRRQTSRIKPASPGPASHTDRGQTKRFKPASPGPASHTDRGQTKRFKPASPGPASHTDRRQTSRIKPVSPGPASHTDRRQTKRFKPASPGPASHTDRRQTSRIKPASPGPASHTDRRQTSRIKPASPGPASHTDRRQTSRIKPASPGPASHTDRRQTSRIKPASPGPASHTDRRQTSRIKPASPGPASHIEQLWLNNNKLSDVETVRLLLENLTPSLWRLTLSDNQFNEEEMVEIERTFKDKHPNLHLWI